MPLYDFACPACGRVTEFITPMDQLEATCPGCRALAYRIISSRSAHRNDADWVESCTVGFDPDDVRPEVRAYLANPADRQALSRAMRAAGIRHMDYGEHEQIKRAHVAEQAATRAAIQNETMERFKARHGL